MATITITVGGQSYTATATATHESALELTRVHVMESLALGEGQDNETPLSERPGYIASASNYLASIFATIPEGERSNARLLQLLDAYAVDRGLAQSAPLTGEALKASLRGYAATKRYNVETGGCIDPNGNAIATDRDSQNKLIAEMVAMGANMRTDPSPWKLRGNGFVMLTNTQMIQAITAARNHIANAFAGEAVALAGIADDSITTPAQIDAINWPSNN